MMSDHQPTHWSQQLLVPEETQIKSLNFVKLKMMVQKQMTD
jgi:hypothetical protein